VKPLAGHRADQRSISIRQATRTEARAHVLLLRRRWLRAADQLNERPKVHSGDLDDVVALLAQRLRDRPARVGRNVQDDDAKAQILHLGNDFGDVLVRAGDERIGDRTAPRESHEVAAQLTLNALASARPDVDQPELEARHLGELVVLCGALSFCDLVPVATQHGQARPVSCQPGEQLEQSRVVPRDGIAAARAVNGHGAICEGIACIDEQRTAIHADTVPSLTRDVTSG